MRSCCALIGVVLACCLAPGAPAPGWSELAGSVVGLWGLAGVMPAGAPANEVLTGLRDSQVYWFLDDGTLSMFQETEEGRITHRGTWKQNGNDIVITWENGEENLVRVVKIGESYMMLTGLGVFSLWFRFVRYF